MTTDENVDAINTGTVENEEELLFNTEDDTVFLSIIKDETALRLTFQERAQLEQVRLLRKLNRNISILTIVVVIPALIYVALIIYSLSITFFR